MAVERFGGRVGHGDRPKCRNTAVPHMQDESREDAKWNYNRNVSRTSTSTASCYQTRYASKTIIIWRKKIERQDRSIFLLANISSVKALLLCGVSLEGVI